MSETTSTQVDILVPGKNYTTSCSLHNSAITITGTFPPLHFLIVHLGDACRKDLKGTIEIPFQHVVASNFHRDTKSLEIAYTWRKRAKGPLSFTSLKAEVEGSSLEAAQDWSAQLMDKAYEGVQRNRRLKVLVNPYGGVGKAVSVFTKTVEPILRAAGCTLDVVYTTHHGHATEIASKLPLDAFDALLTVSGDGLIHEVLNGLAQHSEPRKALSTAVAPIPTGSGNALSLNLMGIKDGFDVVAASINAIKGKPISVDLFLITQSGKSSISFMSQSVGLMADLDVGTDHLRWLGETRFLYGFLRGLIRLKSCNIELSYRIAEDNKAKISDTFRGMRKHQKSSPPSPPIIEEEGGLLQPKYSTTDTEGWTTFSKPAIYVYAGKGPYVGRDYMAFPASLPDDGLIDIVVRGRSSRGEILLTLDEGRNGTHFWNENVNYIKAHAYRMRPLSSKGSLSIDGEAFPFEEFQVEVLPRYGSLLSLHDTYALDSDFTL
ncbi:hypothetical protein E1B28_008854 [Marasmius oreades]|uniref:DAGKc domain-containing protein n=1 Tax=Marasmius oreades TaxID=181124 RepID=A0A9P7S0U8_9AGAR|nr:uncharacterized protein E1B28_008854 [Marasmius oreades]KAG7092503.1 hypothetical protein E1B28_008854 [Marasmius oreades]